jgi:REP element-mobilizing transposase RayT
MEEIKTDIYLETFENNFFMHKNSNSQLYLSRNNYVTNKRSILTINDEYSQNEIKTTNILKRINNYYLYFNIFEEIQHAKIGELNESNFERMDLCVDNHILFIYNDNHKIDFTSFIMSFHSCRDFLLNLIESHREILKILCITKTNELCIFNICPNHILFDDTLKPQLSNFTKTFSLNLKTTSHLDLKNYLKGENYTYKPIEVHLLYYLLYNNEMVLDDGTIDIISSKFVEDIKIFDYFSTTFKIEYKHKCNIFMRKYLAMNKDDIIKDILKYSNTWDYYSICIIYLHIISNIIPIFSIREGFIVKFLNMLVKNLDPEPLNRDCVYEIDEYYDELFIKYNNWDFVSELSDNNLKKLYDKLRE